VRVEDEERKKGKEIKKTQRETKKEIMIAVCCIVTSCSLLSTNISKQHVACTSYIQVVTLCTTRFNIQQGIYVFILISEQTAIISLYSINWLVFIREI